MTNHEQQQQLTPAAFDGSMDSPVILVILVVAAVCFGAYHIKEWLRKVYRCYECKATLPEKGMFCDGCQDKIEKEHFS
jgi:rRNA maturation endonuclease Nob1